MKSSSTISRRRSVATLFILLTTLSPHLSAQASIFQSVDGNSWFDDDNWYSGQLPTADDDVFIYNDHSAVVASTGAVAHSLLIGFANSGSLTVENGGTGSSSQIQLNSDGRFLVTGIGSSWTVTEAVSLNANSDANHITVSAGGGLTASSFTVGSADNGTVNQGNILVTGAGSHLVDTATGGYWGLTLGSGDYSTRGIGSGTLTISDGASAINSIVAVGYWGSGAVLVSGAGSTWEVGRLQMAYDGGSHGSVTVEQGATVSVGFINVGYAGASPAVGAHSAGTGSITVRDTGSQFTLADTYFPIATGNSITVADGGTLRIGSAGDGSLYFDPGATLTIGTGGTAGMIAAGMVNNRGAMIFNFTDNLIFNTPITQYYGDATDVGTLTKTGAGTLILTADNTYTGGTFINAGTVQIGNGSGDGSITGNVAIATGAALAFNRSNNLAFAGIISGDGSVVQTGSNTLTLSADNTYTGGTRINSGTLSVSNNTNLGNASGSVTLAGGNLRLANNAATTFNRAVTVTANSTLTPSRASSSGNGITHVLGTLSLGSHTLTIARGSNFSTNQTGSVTFGSTSLTGNATLDLTNVNGSGIGVTTLGALNDHGTARSLTKKGTGTLTLASAATSLVNGTAINLEAGVTNLNNATALGSLANVTLSSGATLAIASVPTLGALNGTGGTVTLGSNTLTIGNTNNNLNSSFGGVISGTNGKLTKAGSGTLTLSGTNTYTGATSVDAGKLFVNGSIANTAVTVKLNSTLGGTGSIGGLTTVQSGARLAPGVSSGTLTFANGLSLNTGAILDFDLGTASDLIRVSSGTLTGSAVAGGITINLADSGGFVTGTYTLVNFSNATLSSFDLSDFVLGSTLSGYNYALAFSGSTLVLTASVIPESTTVAQLFGAATLVFAAVRRRRR
ncbi:beta strand repeat-containing protein [Rariglobus hedericola]|uniref:PEP-CTERM sorting domain-containing protein n=1 Tax=Rariglobus hedericola TaxID=2597822 RepID=A0A556QKJ9_9BACT|nr:autotransporter-associated beta strand repeat-containing protein [Rariglobus hedericola]TSJ77170.1 hypothetical protein FPL22_13800 [Rariglobus hedericola]